jgi:hypothetical protein
MLNHLSPQNVSDGDDAGSRAVLFQPVLEPNSTSVIAEVSLQETLYLLADPHGGQRGSCPPLNF